MDCSKTEVFLAEWYRMCIGYKTYTQIETECKMHHACSMCVNCKKWVTENPEAAIEIVQEWSDAHPPKTRLSVLKEQYPRYEYRNTDGLPTICAGVLYGFSCGCTATNVHDCERCWNTPIEQGVQ